MAITIVNEPEPFWPICNNVVWVFESDQTSQPNFSFIVELYINGSLHSTNEVYPESANVGKFNISTIGRSVLTSIYPDAAELAAELNPDVTWSLMIYEKYGNPPVINLGSSTFTSGINFLNGSFRYQDATTGGWDYQDYDIETGGKGPFFMTDFPRNRKDMCSYDQYKFLSIINSDGDFMTGYVNLYNITGTLIASATWTGVLATGLLTPMVCVSPITLVLGTSLVQSNFNNCYYYTIQLKQTAAPSKASEIYKIYYDQECSSYPRRSLIWLNKYGAWDSFAFTLLSEESTDVTSNTYNRQSGRWTAGDYIYSLSDGFKMTQSKFMQDRLILNSDWIHEDVQQWLARELYESPRVYLLNDFGSSVLEPVNVTNVSYTLKQRRKAGLIQEQVQIDRTYTKVSQLG